MTALPECMPSTAELRNMGARLAMQGACMRIDEASGGLALAGLLPHQRDNVVLAWVGTWCAEWARGGFPVIAPPRVDCESLMHELAPPGLDIHAPYPFFLFELPEGLVQVRNREGVFETIDRMLCMHFAGLWSYTALARTTEVRHWQQTTNELIAGDNGRHGDRRIVELPWDDDDANANALMSRMLVNASHLWHGS